MFAHSPAVGAATLRLVFALLTETRLDPALRELIILRVAPIRLRAVCADHARRRSFLLKNACQVESAKMVTTVHEDDLAAWYRTPEPGGNISIRDFELDDDELFPESFQFVQPDNEDESIDSLLYPFRNC